MQIAAAGPGDAYPYVDLNAVRSAARAFLGAVPFNHAVIDGFFDADVATALEAEFPDYDSELWHHYSNPVEVKKTCNNWNVFPPLTYRVFRYLNSTDFTVELGAMLGIENLFADPGLNGGGWHIHRRGGKLNTHLDYNLHPKLGLQRKLNIIVYLNSRWQPQWGGQLGLWAQRGDERKPGELVCSIDPAFNRAVVFDTTQDSWHGLPQPLECPPDEYRRSIAAYYLVPGPERTEDRGKALFTPAPGQEGDAGVLALIEARARVDSAATVYSTNAAG